MHIEIFKGKREWHWHFVNRGRITADAEGFPSKGNAVRAAKAVVRGVIRAMTPGCIPTFTASAQGSVTIITWW